MTTARYTSATQFDADGKVIRSIPADQRIVVNLHGMAILNTDIQTAFMPDHVFRGVPVGGGGLAVKDGNAVVEAAIRANSLFPARRRYNALDQHPPGHIACAYSYRDVVPFSAITEDIVKSWGPNDILSPYFDAEYLLYYLSQTYEKRQSAWWEHALMGTEQAKIHPGLRHLRARMTLIKGADPRCDSLSPFKDNMGRSTGLGERMTAHGVQVLVTGGLAGDICAGLGALHAMEDFGFNVIVLSDMCRHVSIEGQKAMDQRILEAGGIIMTSDQLVAA